MTKLKVLIEGYARTEGDIEHASSSTTLIQANGLNIVVDPGMDRSLLIEKLKAESLVPADINFVALSHTHLDHCMLAGMFENAKIVDGDSVYSFDGTIVAHDGKIPGTDIEVIATPGHDQFHCSFIVNVEEFGKVAVAGDIFWFRSDDKQTSDTASLVSREDPYVKNEKQLTESRKAILKLADYIVPGHGKMFKVSKSTTQDSPVW